MSKAKITRKKVKAKIAKIFLDYEHTPFNNENVSTMDSLDKVEFVMHIEDKFDIEILDEKIFPFPKTTDEIVDRVIRILKGE